MARRLNVWFGTLGILAAFFVAVAPATARPEADVVEGDAAVLRSYYAGNGFLNRQNYDLAAAEYRKFLGEHPKHEKAPIARYGLSVSLFRLGKYQEAVPELELLHGASDFQYAPEGLMIEGQCRLALGDNQGAAATLANLVSGHPTHDLVDEALAIQAEALYRAGRHGEVAAPAGKLVKEHPDSAQRERAELFWGLADMAEGSFDSSAARFAGMIERFPDGDYANQVMLLLAQSQHRDEQLAPAAISYRAVIERGDARFMPDALFGVGLVLHQLHKPAEAAPFLDQLLDSHAEHKLARDGRMLRGQVAFELEDYTVALGQFAAVEAEDGPRRDEAAYWHAKCELRQERPADAARRLATALETYPTSTLRPEMTYDRAVALLRSEDPEAAIETLATFREAFPTHAMAPDALHLMAVTEHQLERFEQSQALCRAFLAAHGDHGGAPLIAFLAGENEFLPGNYEPAAEAYASFLVEYPDDDQLPKARYRLGMALHQLDRFEDAKPHLEAVADGADTAPQFRSALLALADGHFQRDEWADAERHFDVYIGFGLDQPAADDSLLKLGLARHRQENFEGAIEAYDRLRETFDGSSFALQAAFERGQACVAIERPEEAATAFTIVLDEGPDSRFAPHALNHLGALSMQGRDYAKAAGHYDRVANVEPQGAMAAEARYQQGQALVAAGDFEGAAVAFGRLTQEHRDSERVPTSAAMEAVTLARHGQHENALAKIEVVEATHADALDAELRVAMAYEKAWCQRELEQLDAAADTYRALLALPGTGGLHQYALIELAEIEFDGERYEVAAGHLKTLRKQDGVPADLQEQALYRLGVCAFHMDDHQEAARLLGKFVEDWPESERLASASLFCGDALFQLGRHQQAVTHLKRVVDKYKDDESCAPSMLRLGECLAILQDFSASEQIFADYQQRYDDSPLWYQAQFGVGWALENQGRFGQAISAYSKVLDQHQGATAARAQFQIGECLFAEDKYEEAARELLKVDILYAYPEWSAAALYEAGRCYEELSNPVTARKQFEKVVSNHKDTDWAKLANERLAEMSDSGLPGR